MSQYGLKAQLLDYRHCLPFFGYFWGPPRGLVEITILLNLFRGSMWGCKKKNSHCKTYNIRSILISILLSKCHKQDAIMKVSGWSGHLQDPWPTIRVCNYLIFSICQFQVRLHTGPYAGFTYWPDGPRPMHPWGPLGFLDFFGIHLQSNTKKSPL